MLSTNENGSGLIVPRVRLNVNGNTTTLLGNSSSVVSNDQWSLITATYTGEQLRLYYNGKLVGVSSLQGTINTSSAPVAIGNRPQGDRDFEGFIDDVCIFSNANTTEEILFLYNSGNGKACDQLSGSNNVEPKNPEKQTPIRPVNNRENNFSICPIMLLLNEEPN